MMKDSNFSIRFEVMMFVGDHDLPNQSVCVLPSEKRPAGCSGHVIP